MIRYSQIFLLAATMQADGYGKYSCTCVQLACDELHVSPSERGKVFEQYAAHFMPAGKTIGQQWFGHPSPSTTAKRVSVLVQMASVSDAKGLVIL